MLTYLALADGRGHLMRAHLTRELCGPTNVVSTSAEGARFYRALSGHRATVLPGGFHVPMVGADLDVRAAQRETARYLSRPSGLACDVRALAALTPKESVLVVDSFHPAGLWLGLTGRRRVLLVHAEHVRAVTMAKTRVPFDRLLQRALERLPVIEASLQPKGAQLYPLTAAPQLWPRPPARRGSSVTASLPGPRPRAESRVVLYLNPNLARAVDAHALCGALRARGHRVVGIGPREAGLALADSRLIDHVASASVVIGAPGIATCAQSKLLQRPLIALLGEQPEQRANFAQTGGVPVELSHKSSRAVVDEILTYVEVLTRNPAPPVDLSVLNENRARWRARILKETHDLNRRRPRDPQPRPRARARRPRGRRAA